VRKQYFFRRTPEGLLAWDVDRLIQLTASFPSRRVLLRDIRELNEPWFGTDESPTWVSLVEHVKLMDAADLGFPIEILRDRRRHDGTPRGQGAGAGHADIQVAVRRTLRITSTFSRQISVLSRRPALPMSPPLVVTSHHCDAAYRVSVLP
jgi:hypothetical protein